ncbi:MAG TPA: outer membrane beta-barrel protein [Mucilaginibacter sp.]
MKKILLLTCLFVAAVFTFKAEAATMPVDTGKAAAAPAPAPTPDPPLVFSGSVDTYYKYDFSGHANIPTSFANEQNSISIGMVDLGLKKTVGNASFVGELSFGPRGQQQSIPNADPGLVSLNGSSVTGTAYSSYHIQNLYVSYNVTPKFNLTMGYMSTFIGYEVISPAANFNYSTSYLFTNGPFQNAGFKATYSFSDKVSLMAGIFNDYWNVYQSYGRVNTFGAQLMVVPVKNWTAYINFATGPASGTEIDLTTTYQITDAFKLGLNAADFSAGNGFTGGFSGVALYPQLAVSKVVTLGIRGEYFTTKTGDYLTAGPAPGESVFGATLTANIKAGPLMVIPEFRLDSSSKSDMFTANGGALTSSASQFVLAAVYAF